MSRTSYGKRENGMVDISMSELARIMTVLGLNKDKVPIFFTQSVPKKQQSKLRSKSNE